MASESVAENYNHFLQELKQETKGHLFTEIPAGGFEAQYIQLLTDSISYFIGKKCHLPDEEIQLSDGMATVSHFNTLPLVAHLGTAVTALSKGILLEVERNIKIINRERMAQHEQTEYQSEIQGAGRDDASRSANLQQQRSRSTPGQVRPDGPGIPQRESPGAIYDFEMDGSLMEIMHRVQDEATEKIEALTQQMLQQEPLPQTEDIMERTRHLNSLKLMAEETVLQSVVLIPR